MQIRLTRNVLIGTQNRLAGSTAQVGDDLGSELVKNKLGVKVEAKKAETAPKGRSAKTAKK